MTHLETLRAVEWAADDVDEDGYRHVTFSDMCPSCGYVKPEHGQPCSLAAAIEAAEKLEATTRDYFKGDDGFLLAQRVRGIIGLAD